MKRGVIFILLLILVLAPYPAYDVESGEQITPISSFLSSADGDESSQSLTLFSETIDNDVLFYSDLFENDTLEKASSGTAGPSEVGDYTDTWTVGAGSYSGDNGVSGESWVVLNFTVYDVIEGFKYAVYATGEADDDGPAELWIYNWTANDWVDTGITMGQGGFAWGNGTTYDPNYWNSSQISLRINSTDIDDITTTWCDYAQINFYIMTLADSDHYAESFADVSDWNAFYHSEVSTDGDVGNITCNLATYGAIQSRNAEGWVNYTVSAGDYAEIRLLSTSTGQYYFKLYYDDGGETGDWKVWDWSSTYGTRKAIISNNVPVGAVIYEVRFYVKDVNEYILVDYLRIGPSDEMGWQHDGSTTAGTDNTYESGGQSNFDFSQSSDSDILTYIWNATTFGSTSTGYQWIVPDTTATVCDLERDYYQFVELRYRITQINSATLTFRPQIDGYYADFSLGSSTTSWTTIRRNLKAMSIVSSNKQFAFHITADAQYDSCTLEIDWIKAYSIANFTFEFQSGYSTSDYAYVDDGVLHTSKSTVKYLKFSYDPALSVAIGTYPVWNYTSSNINPTESTDINVQFYIDGAWGSLTADESRGGLSGTTLTAIRFYVYSTIDISAIKFIEDSTAPSVVRSFANPPDPSDDESVTLSAVVEDTIEVYSVDFNAIVYPSGFSDVDYSATEQSDNLWSYEFSTMTAGHYTFKIIASDGANENSLTEYAYIDFEVRTGTIVISPISFFGVGEDFTQMQMSFEINRDCTYTIYEASDSYAESDTHTGSVVEGWNNIAWGKIDVVDELVNFSVSFVNGSLSTWVNGSYSVAQNTFYLETVIQSESYDAVTIAGRITKLANYIVYSETGTTVESGTIDSLDFKIDFAKWAVGDEQDHAFAIRFANASQTCWYNSSYYSMEKESGGGMIDTKGWAFDIGFWEFFGILIIVGALVTIPTFTCLNLPNWRGGKK